MKNLLKNKTLIDLAFIFILSLTPLLWFKGNLIMVGHDNVFPLDPLTFLIGRLFTWIEHDLGRSQALIMGTIPIHLIDAIPYLLGLSLQVTQKIVYVFWFFMMGLGSYILARAINRDSRVFRLTAVVLYIFNFFILQAWFIGERTKFSAYIAFPLILAVFYKVYKGELKIIRGAIYNTLILFIFNAGGIFGTPLYGGFFIGITTFIFFFSGLSFYKKKFDIVIRLLFLTIFSLAGFLLINAYVLFPAVSQIASSYTKGIEKTGGTSGLIDWAGEISANASYSNLFRLQGIAEWYDNPEHPYAKFYFNNPFLIAISFLWPLLVILALILIKNKKYREMVKYLFLVYLIGIFFSAGTHPPLGFLYTLFMKFIPGAVIFRSPYFKFAPAVFLASSFLIAFFIDGLNKKYRNVIFILILVVTLLYYFPYFTGSFFEWRKGFSTRNNVPNYVYEFGKWAEENKENGRILMLPQSNNNWQYDIYKWGYLSLQFLPTLVTNSEVLINDDKLNGEEQKLVSLVYKAIEDKDKSNFEQLATLLRIKYLVVRDDIKHDLLWAPTISSNEDRKIIEREFEYPLLKSFGKWHIYKIDFEEMSKIYTTSNLNYIDIPFSKIENYFYLAKGDSQFYLKDSSPKDFIISSKMQVFNYFFPICLNCRHEVKPTIGLPEKNILPDSPLYQLMLFKEKRESTNLSNKDAVYNKLGLSLKRLSEFREFIPQKRVINIKILDDYMLLLKELKDNFNQIYDYKDRFETAEDVGIYLGAERKILKDIVLNSNLLYGENAKKIEEVFFSISNAENLINPYLFKLDPKNNRLFQFSSASGVYEIFLKKEELKNLLKEKDKIKITIDNNEAYEIEMDQQLLKNNWLSLGKKSFSSGTHRIALAIREIPNLLGEFKPDQNGLNFDLGDKCYSSEINNFNYKIVYRMKLDFADSFSDKLYLYVKKNDRLNKNLEEVFKFKENSSSGGLESLIYSLADVKKAFIVLCGNNLNKESIDRKIKISVGEVIQPILLLTPLEEITPEIKNVAFKMNNPTEYILDVKGVKNPQMLIFAERYDSSWELSEFNNNHFKINGYANGWLIDKPGSYKLKLVYRPQQFFYYGLAVTVFTLLSLCLFLMKSKNN